MWGLAFTGVPMPRLFDISFVCVTLLGEVNAAGRNLSVHEQDLAYLASVRARQTSRTASPNTGGMRTLTMSPLRKRRAMLQASRLSVLILSPGFRSVLEGDIRTHSTPFLIKWRPNTAAALALVGGFLATSGMGVGDGNCFLVDIESDVVVISYDVFRY